MQDQKYHHTPDIVSETVTEVTLEQYKAMSPEQIKALPIDVQIKLAKAKREEEQGKVRKAAQTQTLAVNLHPKAMASMRKVARKAAKTAAKKAPSTPSKPKSMGKKAVAKPKPAKRTPAKAVPSKARTKTGVACSICGKPLSQPGSVNAGMGWVCQTKHKLLPKGMTLEEHYESMTEVEVPDGWIKLKDAVQKAKAKGVSGYRFVQAFGGDRMLRKPISKVFKVIIVKGVRYMDGDCLKHLKELEKI